MVTKSILYGGMAKKMTPSQFASKHGPDVMLNKITTQRKKVYGEGSSYDES